ncbi:hypothetical protein Tco_1267431 [Tanacetum coccineum]
MLQFLSNSCVSVALTKQPSAYYSKYLWEFWYTAEADTTTSTITFTLSSFDKPLSFNLDDFSTIIDLKHSKNLVPLPPKETVKAALATLGLVDENDTSISSTNLANSSPPAEKPVAIADATQSIDVSESAEKLGNHPKPADAEKEEVRESGLKSMGDVPLDEFGRADANLDADESPFDTKSEIKFIRKEVPKFIYNGSHVNKDATKGFSLSNQVIQKADSDLESMPGDEIESLSEFEADESNDDDRQSVHKKYLTKTDEAAADNILDELADMAKFKNENMNSFADKPSQSDPLGHLHKDLSSLTSKLAHLESSLAQ